METGAYLSEDRRYRYSLWCTWDGSKGYVMFVGLNPSTADETQDDPTIRRCIRFSKDWGYGGVYMVNLFAVRATDPKDMKLFHSPIGPENDKSLMAVAHNAGKIVCAWGANGNHLDRDKQVFELLSSYYDLQCLGVTKAGHPRHPLYIKADKPLEEYWGNFDYDYP